MDNEKVCRVLYNNETDSSDFDNEIDDPNYINNYCESEDSLKGVLALDSESDEHEGQQQNIYSGPTIIEASDDDDNLYTIEDIEDVDEGVIKKGKKRILNKHLWAQNVAKRLKATGVEHVSLKKKLVPMRVTGPDCMCKMSCFAKIKFQMKKNNI